MELNSVFRLFDDRDMRCDLCIKTSFDALDTNNEPTEQQYLRFIEWPTIIMCSNRWYGQEHKHEHQKKVCTFIDNNKGILVYLKCHFETYRSCLSFAFPFNNNIIGCSSQNWSIHSAHTNNVAECVDVIWS